jgi:hypothetical protein
MEVKVKYRDLDESKKKSEAAGDRADILQAIRRLKDKS